MSKPISIDTTPIELVAYNASLYLDPYIERFQTKPEELDKIIQELYDKASEELRAVICLLQGVTNETKRFLKAYHSLIDSYKATEAGLSLSKRLADLYLKLAFETYSYNRSTLFVEVNRLYQNTSKEQRDYICSLDYEQSLMKEFLDTFKDFCRSKETQTPT